jgi:putative phosphoribosyl transferase
MVLGFYDPEAGVVQMHLAISFRDRREAGQLLASKLSSYAGRSDVVVLGLPRGGVPVAFEVAKILKVSLDVFVVRKLGVPGDEELAMGATAAGKVRVLNEDVIKRLAIPDEVIESVATGEERELARRERQYRENRTPVEVDGKTVILVDDGLATGSTMHAAVLALRSRNPAHLVVAVPVAASETCEDFKNEVDEIVCATTPEPFYAVGQWYKEFSQTSDKEVRELLSRAAQNEAVSGP